MSSSDLNSDKSIESKAIDDKEDLDALADSIDASLDAILSEAKEVAQPAADSETAPAVNETAPVLEALEPLQPPPAEVQMAAGENGAGNSVLTDEMETPLPVIVEDEEPSYKAFADMVASTEAPRNEANEANEPSEPAPEMHAAEVSTESAEPESGEILDADELIDSMTPAPVLLDAAEPAVSARTEESAAYVEPPPPPSDEEILDHVKLPPGSTPMPMPLVASLAPEAPVDSDAPGASLEDDQTVISPMPPMPEPTVSLPPPRRMNSAWAVPPEPSILLASEGVGTKFGKMVKAPIPISAATLAGVVLLASAVGGGVVRLLSGPTAPSKVVATAPAQAEAPAPAPAIVPAVAEKAAAVPAPTPTPAVAEKPADKAIEKAAEKPAPAKVAAKPAAKPAPAPQRTHMALAEPKPAPAKKAAPAAKPKKAAPATAWVDPFGQ